jgi:hypothetical protein
MERRLTLMMKISPNGSITGEHHGEREPATRRDREAVEIVPRRFKDGVLSNRAGGQGFAAGFGG